MDSNVYPTLEDITLLKNTHLIYRTLFKVKKTGKLFKKITLEFQN